MIWNELAKKIIQVLHDYNSAPFYDNDYELFSLEIILEW